VTNLKEISRFHGEAPTERGRKLLLSEDTACFGPEIVHKNAVEYC